MKRSDKLFRGIMFLSLILTYIGCSESSDDQGNIEQQKLKRSKEVRDSLAGEIVLYRRCCKIIEVPAKYGGSGTEVAADVPYIGPKWSGDGTIIAFIRLESDLQTSVGYWYLTLVNKGTLEQQEWIVGTSEKISNVRNITWSSDGRYVAVLTDDNIIIYVETTTGEIIQTELKGEAGEYYISVAWKPASNKIAISLRTGDVWSGNIKNSIWLHDAFGNDPREDQENLLVNTSITATIEHMDWNIDGSMLAYSEGNVYSRIYVINSDGSGNRGIILKDLFKDEEARGFAPCWSRDNKQLVFTGVTGVSGTTLVHGLFVTEISGSYLVDIKIAGELPDWY